MFVMECENRLEFIWGIKSNDDLTTCSDATLDTLNDIDICYDAKNKEYILSIETIYVFPSREEKKKYYVSLLDGMEKWLGSHGYQFNEEPDQWIVFTQLLGSGGRFDTIQELYATFKVLVKGFCLD
jgi:hypothetical protein